MRRRDHGRVPMSPNEEARAKQDAERTRRLARLRQVREQEEVLGQRLLSRQRSLASRRGEKRCTAEKDEWMTRQQRGVDDLHRKYQETLAEVGAAHHDADRARVFQSVAAHAQHVTWHRAAAQDRGRQGRAVETYVAEQNGNAHHRSIAGARQRDAVRQRVSESQRQGARAWGADAGERQRRIAELEQEAEYLRTSSAPLQETRSRHVQRGYDQVGASSGRDFSSTHFHTAYVSRHSAAAVGSAAAASAAPANSHCDARAGGGPVVVAAASSNAAGSVASISAEDMSGLAAARLRMERRRAVDKDAAARKANDELRARRRHREAASKERAEREMAVVAKELRELEAAGTLSGDPVFDHSLAALVIECLAIVSRSFTLVWRGLTGLVVAVLVVAGGMP